MKEPKKKGEISHNNVFDQDLYLVDPGRHRIGCFFTNGPNDFCSAESFIIFRRAVGYPRGDPRRKGYIYAFRSWRRLPLIRFLATAVIRDHHLDESCPGTYSEKIEEAVDQKIDEYQELLRKLREIQENKVEVPELTEAVPIEPVIPVTPAGQGGPRFGGGRVNRVEDPLKFTASGIPYLERTGPIKRTKEGVPIGESLGLGAGGPNLGPITFLTDFGGGSGGGGSRRSRRQRSGGIRIPFTPPISSNRPFDDSDWNVRRREGFGGGDPQCSSYDGFRFECNFLGEALWTRCGAFAVHVFAERPSNTSRATVIRGFAVKQETNLTDVFYAALTEEQNSSFEFALNGEVQGFGKDPLRICFLKTFRLLGVWDTMYTN